MSSLTSIRRCYVPPLVIVQHGLVYLLLGDGYGGGNTPNSMPPKGRQQTKKVRDEPTLPSDAAPAVTTNALPSKSKVRIKTSPAVADHTDEPDRPHAVAAVTDRPDAVAGEGLFVTDIHLTKG
jgi:hypothetical protein